MNDVLAYLAVLFGAMVPWFELFVIPPGIAFGLEPVGVGLAAFAGNAVVTLAVIVGWERLAAWWERRRGRPLGMGAGSSGRARRAFDRYGVPGLALQGPVVSGMYFGVILALALGAPRRSVVVWSLVSIAAWTIALTAGTLLGVSFLT